MIIVHLNRCSLYPDTFLSAEKENKIYQGTDVATLNPGIQSVNWAQCAEHCAGNKFCTAFIYNEKQQTCYLKRDTKGEPFYKENHTYSRKCGSTDFNCPKSECRDCMRLGYTNELEG